MLSLILLIWLVSRIVRLMFVHSCWCCWHRRSMLGPLLGGLIIGSLIGSSRRGNEDNEQSGGRVF